VTVTRRTLCWTQERLQNNFAILEDWLQGIFEQKGTEETEERLSVCTVFSVASVQIGTRND
jgi:hypothetical protein